MSAPTRAALLITDLHWSEPISGLVCAAIVAAIAGFLSGWLLLRYRGLALLVLTLSTTIMLQQLGNLFRDFTGGYDGIPSINIAPLFGWFDYDLYGHTYYLYCLGVLLVTFYVVRRIVYSPFGQALVGIRENVGRMHALGSPVHWRLVVAYTISAGVAGIAGALFAHTNTLVTLGVFDFDQSAAVLMMLILGGAGWLYGAFIGAVLYMVLQNELAKLSPAFWQFGIGLILVAVVLLARHGVYGRLARFGRSLPLERAAMTAPALEIRNLRKNFGALQVANDINLALPRGARHALIGPNGAGKTTLVNLITGRIRASSGRCLLDGEVITSLPQAGRIRRGIARTFQVNQLFRGLTVLENVYLAIGERTGACNRLWRSAGRETAVIDEALDHLQSLELVAGRLQAGAGVAVRTAATCRNRHRAGAAAETVAARRACRRRAVLGKPSDPRRHRKARSRTSRS